ncbi:MAG: hypothetical protein JWM64_622, partial [Frankiales bacterium]|nr:hypothetical protein [Frankiales bacterium]
MTEAGSGTGLAGGVRTLLVGGERLDPRTSVSLDAPGTWVEATAELLVRAGSADERLFQAGSTLLALRT